MQLEAALRAREAGALCADRPAAAFGHRPARFEATAASDVGLAKRLQEVAQLPGHAGSVNAVAWSDCGSLLLTGGEDCRLRLWRGVEDGELLHSFDSGHTSNILSALFLPATGGDHVVSCSADKQVRHLNVVKGAVRPYSLHKGRVRSLVALDPYTFLSASEDGTVREFDVRLRPPAAARGSHDGQQHLDDANVLVDQRAERVGRSRVRVGIYSLAVDECRPWLMLTGGTDPLVRMYDRRMLPAPGEAHGGSSRSRAPQWLRCYIPAHLKSALWDLRPPGSAAVAAAGPASYQLPAVVFARGGAEVVASYSGDFIYSFDVAEHGRELESLLHVPEPALRVPARPRSHAGRRSVHAWSPAQQLGSPPSLQLAGPGALSREGSQAVQAALAVQAVQLRRQQAARGMGIAASLRQLEEQRRQLSRVPAAAEPPALRPARAESSRPAHRQLRPTSSTLRSPLQEGRPNAGQLQQQQQQQQQQHDLVGSESECSEGGVPHAEGHHQQQQQQGQPGQQGVRRSRRIRQRRREAEQAQAQEAEAEQQALADAQAEAAGAEAGLPAQLLDSAAAVQAAAVSGIAEQAGPEESDVDDATAPSPARRRVRRRLAGSAVDEAAGQQAQQHVTHAVPQDAAGPSCPPVAAAAAAAEFRQPEGRAPPRASRRLQQHPSCQQRLDSTIGLLQHQPSVLETSEVGPVPPQQRQQQAQALQEPTVSMAPPGGQRAALGPQRQRSPAAEVTSRPVLSASRQGVATQQGSLQLGHEVSSLNSAEQPAGERVESVAQQAPAEAPSVGNAPRPAGWAEAQEASTGHMRNHSVDRHLQAHLQQQLAQQRQRQGPAASTAGTLHLQRLANGLPGGGPAGAAGAHSSGRLASRLRRYAAAMSGAAGAVVGSAGAGEGEAAGPSLLQTQATMLSGRGPSLIGDFMPGQAQAADSEIVQGQQGQQGEVSGGAGLEGNQHQQELQEQGQAAVQRPALRAQQQAQQQGQQPAVAARAVDSNVGAIMHNADADAGEEVSEPTMYRNCFAGHLNLLPAAGGHAGLAATPPLAFMGSRSELLVAPSDDGSLFVWQYSSGRLLNVLEASPGSPTACVAAHPRLPCLASGGADAVVRLWSPEAQEQCSMAHAAAAVQANAQALLGADQQQAVQPPPGLQLLPGAQLGGALLLL